jgi:hypothetical protein
MFDSAPPFTTMSAIQTERILMHTPFIDYPRIAPYQINASSMRVSIGKVVTYSDISQDQGGIESRCDG